MVLSIGRVDALAARSDGISARMVLAMPGAARGMTACVGQSNADERTVSTESEGSAAGPGVRALEPIRSVDYSGRRVPMRFR